MESPEKRFERIITRYIKDDLGCEVVDGYPYFSPFADLSEKYVQIGNKGIVEEGEVSGLPIEDYMDFINNTKNQLKKYCTGKKRAIIRTAPEYNQTKAGYYLFVRLLADDGIKEIQKAAAA